MRLSAGAGSLSRRAFLKLSSALLAGAAWRPDPPETPPAPVGVGRAIVTLRLYAEPDFGSDQVGLVAADRVFSLLEAYTAPAELAPPATAHNLVWYRVKDGWLHSGFVQPVSVSLNAPLPPEAVPPDGLLTEVTVPFTDAWRGARRRAYRIYYSQTHWADQAIVDDEGRTWYRVIDDLSRGYYFVLAEHLRPVPTDELTPLAPGVTDKRIEVDLTQQKLTAYENGREVLVSRVASGLGGTSTPRGDQRVIWKRASRHMAGGGPRGYDLPGVPWCSYFHWNGVALHGTYWHNDFGRPRSHGCVNLPSDAARWLYRWTMPTVPPGQEVLREPGTTVVVF